MFHGEYQHTIDGKGRLILPAKFRESLADGLVVTKGFENCLFVFSQTEWPQIESKMQSLQVLRKEARKVSRFFFSGVSEQEPDKNGRIMIPPHLRQHARIDKDVVVLGVSSRLEIWAKEMWESYAADAEQSYEAAAEELAELGF